MMDLLVQITSAHRINPGGHVIQVMNDRSDDFLYYKPSTPIGKNFWKGRMFGTRRISFCQFSLFLLRNITKDDFDLCSTSEIESFFA